MSYEITISCGHGYSGTHRIEDYDFEFDGERADVAIISAWLECPICGTVGTEDAQLVRIKNEAE